MAPKYDIEGIWEVLGLQHDDERPPSMMRLWARIQEGFPASAMEVAYRGICGNDPVQLRKIASLSTLQRRRRDAKRLSPGTSETLVRVARVWLMIVDVYGDEDMARRFLTSPHMMLGGQSPLSIASSNALGADAVACLVGRLRSGVAV